MKYILSRAWPTTLQVRVTKSTLRNLKLGKKLHFLVRQNLQILHLLKAFPRSLLQQRLWACITRFEYLTIHRMNPIQNTLYQPGDKKTHLRADFGCKWTPFSLQGEYFITTIFWIPDGSPLQVRLRVTEKLRIFRGRRTKEKTKAWTIFWFIWTRTSGDLTSSHTLISCTLLLIYMTFELNFKCLWQHPATSNQLEITK